MDYGMKNLGGMLQQMLSGECLKSPKMPGISTIDF